MNHIPLSIYHSNDSFLRMDCSFNLVNTKFSAEPDAANVAPTTNPPVGSSSFAYPTLGNVCKLRLHNAGLNPAANLG